MGIYNKQQMALAVAGKFIPKFRIGVNLPEKLEAEGINPKVTCLYNFKGEPKKQKNPARS